MVRVSTSNFYVGNPHPAADAKLLASFGCDVSGIQEGHSGNAQAIKESLARTHITFWGKSKNEGKQFAYLDVPVVYPKGLDVLRSWARQISKRAQKKNIGMPRAATAVRFKKNGKTYTFINTHTNAGIRGKNPNRLHLPVKIKRVAEFVAGMIVLETMIRNAQRRGDYVILVGDLNYRVEKKGVWKFSPQGLFQRTKLKFHSAGLDYIAYSRNLEISNINEIPASRTGSDHPWLVADLHERR